MERKHRIILAALAIGLISIFISIIYAENGLLDLLKLKDDWALLKTENSKKGRELFDDIDYYQRLAKNDPKLIESIAREQGLIGMDELVVITGEQQKSPPEDLSKEENPENSRLLSEHEYAVLFNFDVDSFKFYEELE